MLMKTVLNVLLNVLWYFAFGINSIGGSMAFAQKKLGHPIALRDSYDLNMIIGVLIGFVGSMIGLNFLIRKIAVKIENSFQKTFAFTLFALSIIFAAVFYFAPEWMF